ncbi:MAG: hypothetical protein KAU03_00025 [Candidatus Altiarchaeales archaeon]|nr:hypothetical protein [Candidatus Altiarchaeales archaeon]
MLMIKTERVIILFILITMWQASGVFLISVNVKEKIDWNIAYERANTIVNNTPQEFLLVWENTGSVACRVRTRTDIYLRENGDYPVYVAWSNEVPVESGIQVTFTSYWYPKESGNYTAKTSVYYCNFLEKGPEVNFTVVKKKIKDKTKMKEPLEIHISNTENYVEFRMKAERDLRDVVIIADRYPLGWIFESGKISAIEEGQEKIIKVNYIPSIWRGEDIVFEIVTMDGGEYMVRNVELEGEERSLSTEQLIMILLSLVIIIQIVAIITMRRKKSRGGE